MFVNRKVLQEKEEVVRFVENTRTILQSFDQKFEELKDREKEWYDEQTEELNKNKKRLHELRLQGDCFVVQVQKQDKDLLLEITDEGTIIFYDLAYTDNPVVPSDMSKLSHFRIQEVKELVCRPGSNRLFSDKAYEVLTSRLVRHISDVYRFRRCEINSRNHHSNKSHNNSAGTFPAYSSSSPSASSSPPSRFSFRPSSSRGGPPSSRPPSSRPSSSRGASPGNLPQSASSPPPTSPSSPSRPSSAQPFHTPPPRQHQQHQHLSPLLSPFASALSALSSLSSSSPDSSPSSPSPPPARRSRPPSSDNLVFEEEPVEEMIGFQIHWKSQSITFKCDDHPEELEEVLGAQLQRFNRSFVAQVEEIKKRWNLSQVGYDITNEEHETKLLHLWDVVFPDTPLLSRKSKQWSDLGFQGKDPATDFRGMGLLGLSLIIFFCETHTERVQAILKADRSYPFAVFGIHLANFLISTMLGVSAKTVTTHSLDRKIWESPLLNFFISCNTENAFEETFCQVFFLFDALWVKMKATYMDFPKVQKALQAEFTTLLERLPLGMKQLAAWVDQVVVSILKKEEVGEELQGGQSLKQRALSDEFESLTTLVFASPKIARDEEKKEIKEEYWFEKETEKEITEKEKEKEKEVKGEYSFSDEEKLKGETDEKKERKEEQDPEKQEETEDEEREETEDETIEEQEKDEKEEVIEEIPLL